jgi:hypothetical protein
MSLLESSFGFPARNNTERQSQAGQALCQFHLPILYHHLDNAGCIMAALVCGGTFLLTDTPINIRQQRYITSSELALIRRQEQGGVKSEIIFDYPANQRNKSVFSAFVIANNLNE